MKNQKMQPRKFLLVNNFCQKFLETVMLAVTVEPISSRSKPEGSQRAWQWALRINTRKTFMAFQNRIKSPFTLNFACGTRRTGTIISKFCAIIALGISSAFGGTVGQSPNTNTTGILSPTPYTVVSRDANSRVWQSTTYEISQSGQTIPHLHEYTELASGLCYQQNGQWVDSQEQISILSDGTAVATNGQHQAYFPPDIYNGAIELITPDGVQLQSRPIGLSYDDGTNTVLIAELTNSVGQLISSNQVIYTNAFVGVSADLLYTYRKGGFEQDLIFREQPTTPEQCGLCSTNSRLQLLTEFFNSPSPLLTISVTNQQDNLADTTLTFGKMKMIRGKAFLMGSTNSQNNIHQISICKSWQNIDSRTFLVEEVPYTRICSQLESLPLPSAGSVSSANSPLQKVSAKRVLPPARIVLAGTNTMQLAQADSFQKSGFVFDYVALDLDQTNYIFQGDTTYYITGPLDFSGTTTLEGGAVIKYSADGGSLIVDGTLNCQTAPYLPAILTGSDDDSVGDQISGSSGAPSGWYANNALDIEGSGTIDNLRISYAATGIYSLYDISVTNVQILNCGNGFYIFNEDNSVFENVLVANVDVAFGGYSTVGALVENGTVVNCGMLFGDDSDIGVGAYVYNSVMANVEYLAGDFGDEIRGNNNAFYSFDVNSSDNSTYNFGFSGTTTTNWPFQTVGAGSYYLADNTFRGKGTTNIDLGLLSQLAQKTTWPPIVYVATNISGLGELAPTATRDTNNSPDLGYHYDALDYVFGGCDLSNNLAVTTGTAVGWFQNNGTYSGQPYAISLETGANLSFNGNATQPCFFPNYAMVQEGGTGNWTGNGFIGSIMFNGNGSSPTPQISANFTKWTDPALKNNFFRDAPGHGQGFFRNCEFYDGFISTYDMQYLSFTNCLFFRDFVAFWDQDYAISMSFENCTFYNGALVYVRSGSGVSSSLWQIENTAFDGTAFDWADSLSTNPTNTFFNYNAYNTNNLTWMSNPYLSPVYGTNEIFRSNDVMVASYNWESSWFGNFYQPTNSPLTQKGSTNANLLGLYHFTTQTNQIPEGTNKVTIGYHYAATDTNGIPLDSNGDGIPDYIEDPLGNGLPYNGTNWALAINVQPTNQTVAEGTAISISVTAGGVPTLAYQWYFNSNLVVNATNSALTFSDVQTSDAGSYFVVVTNGYGAITSSLATLTVVVPPTIVTQPVDVTANITSNVTFAVTMTTNYTSPLIYQWLWDGNPLIGATNSSLTIFNIEATNVGYYSVVVTNVAGSVSSSSAWLTITIFSPAFTNNSAIQVEGTACFTNTLQDGRVLQMTPSPALLAPDCGSAWLINPVLMRNNASFSAFFTFRLSKSAPDNLNDVDGSLGGDGIVFVAQTLTNNEFIVGTNGGGGGGLEYFGMTNSVGIVFDTFWDTGNATLPNGPWDPFLTNSQTVLITTNANGTTGDGNHVGVVYNGFYTNAATFHYGVLSNGLNVVAQHVMDNLNNSNIWYAWIDYNGSTSNLEIRLSETNSRPMLPTLTNIVNLVDFLGRTNAYLGFTAATWGAYNEQDILSWEFTSPYHPIGQTTNQPYVSVQFVAPTNSQLFVFSPTNIYLSATTSDSSGTVTNVVFTDQTHSITLGSGTLTNSVWQLFWQFATNGIYTITATATDSLGNVATDTVTITNNAMPQVNIISPANLQLFSEVTNITIQASATDSDGSITNVQFYAHNLDTDNLLTNLTVANGGAGNYDITWSNRTAGSYAILAVATDDREQARFRQFEFLLFYQRTFRPPSAFFRPPMNPRLRHAEMLQSQLLLQMDPAQ